MQIWSLRPDTGEAYKFTDANSQEGKDVEKLQFIGLISEISPDNLSYYLQTRSLFNPAIIQRLEKARKDIYIEVNGMTDKDIQQAAHYFKSSLCLVYKDMGDDMTSFCQQLVWLQSAKNRFAVNTNNRERLLVAAMMQPYALITTLPQEDIQTVMNSVALQSVRSTTPAEADNCSNQVISLSVDRDLPEGCRLTSKDLVTTLTDSRGLSPGLKESVQGCILRYPVCAGDPLTFGHLYPHVCN